MREAADCLAELDAEADRLRAIKKSDDGAYAHVVDLWHAVDEDASNLADSLLQSEAREKAWMNGVADAVERLGYDREAACGPADLLPGLERLVALWVFVHAEPQNNNSDMIRFDHLRAVKPAPMMRGDDR